MTRRAALDVIEAAYHTGGSTEDWLRAIGTAMPAQADGIGYVCSTYRITPTGHLVFDDLVELDTPGDMESPTRAVSESLPPEYVATTWGSLSCGTALSSGRSETREISRAQLHALYGQFGVRDILVVNGLDPTHHGVWLAGMVGRELQLSRRDYAKWSRVSAHLVASYRLRRAQAEEPAAVITPAGKIEHVIEDARTVSAREALRAAALAIDRARTRRAHIEEDEAVEMWQALVRGRWTLIDHVDTDGRRYFIARKNDPDVARHHQLTRRERQVAGYAGLGHSNKLIAYELGLSVSAIAVYLNAAMLKLGIGSRGDLILIARAFGADTEAVR